MDALRLNDVVVRVVAWHNRHPLARRITPDQVHSIGEVVLPFRSRSALPGQGAQPTVAPPEPKPAEDEQSLAVDLSRESASAGPVEALEPLAPAWAAPAPQPSALVRISQSLRAVWERLPRPRWPGPRLAPAFSEKFIWPMTPAAVAKWAERHAARSTIAPEDWPRRWVSTDGLLAHRLEAQGLAVALELHLLSAAIGVGDRRIRLLLDARNSIVGPRAYSPTRMTGCGSALVALVLATLFGTGALPLPTTESLLASLPSAHPPTMVVGVVSPAPEPMPESAASPIKDEPVPHQTPAASAVAAPPEEPATPQVLGHVSTEAQVDAESAHVPAVTVEHSAEVTASASAPRAASAPAVAAAPTAPVPSAARPFALVVRPLLGQDERHAARESSVRLRGQTAPAKPVAVDLSHQAQASPTAGPVYALVTAPTRLRDDSLVLLTRARSLSGLDSALKSARSDLISAQGLWQAALWPFGSRADAERARITLAGKGLKAQVVEF